MQEQNNIDRIKLAEDLFMQGFNCSQAVVAAFADLYGYSERQALQISAGHGAGIGRMRMTCGAVCALATLAGMHCGATTPDDRIGKSECYRVVQSLANEFAKKQGSVICAELLKLKKDAPLDFIASERTAEYYKTRPCVQNVITAAKIYSDFITNQSQA